MTSDQFGRQMAHSLLQPSVLGAMAFAVCFVAVCGYLSLRVLRRLPDFEHKREMMAGARWGWAAALLGVRQSPTRMRQVGGSCLRSNKQPWGRGLSPRA